MNRMVRKQIYLAAQQERGIKRLARERGISESELIRGGIDSLLREAEMEKERAGLWENERAFIRKWIDKGTEGRTVPAGRTWRREDLYDRPRLARH